MDSSQLLHILLAVTSISCSPEQNRTDEQNVIMKTIDAVGHQSFLMGDNFFHSVISFILFSMLVIIRNLPVSVAIFSIALFFISLRYKRWIIHASCTLVISLVFLINDSMVHILCLIIRALSASAAEKSLYLLSPTDPTRRDIFQTIQDSIPESLHKLCNLWVISTVINILLILACVYLLLQIKKTTTKVFYLREFRFCFILEIFHFAVSFHSPLTLATTLTSLHGYTALAAGGLEISLCMLICLVCHSIIAKLPDTKRLSVEK